MVKVTRAHPENRVWSHTFTPKKGSGGGKHEKTDHILGDMGCSKSSGWLDQGLYKHKVHTTFVIYKYTAVLQVFKFHKKEEGGERGKLKTKHTTH